MPLNKPSGNMYPWAYTWNPLAGECQYRCDYCYVSGKIAPMMERVGNEKYSGNIRLVTKEFKTKLVVPKGFVVFVQSCGDLFHPLVHDIEIQSVLEYIQVNFPNTPCLFQSKNPARFFDFEFPPNSILGTTIETNRKYPYTNAPDPHSRFLAMKEIPTKYKTMWSIEPVMDFDLPILLSWLGACHPNFVSIGADSGGHNLPEPTPEKLKQLLWQMELLTEVRRKNNLKRLVSDGKRK